MFQLLIAAKTGEIPHSGANLLEHLKNVHAILQGWDQPGHVRLGGLFHSIYGTQSFKRKPLELKDRVLVADVIGERAERLAYLFCVLRRPFLARTTDKGYRVRRHGFGAEDITRDEMRELEIISVANRLELEWRRRL